LENLEEILEICGVTNNQTLTMNKLICEVSNTKLKEKIKSNNDA
jgi:hypothetical protein